jgi:hypothetical protein
VPDESIEVEFPEAPPSDYLDWASWFREIERALRDRPEVEAQAVSLGVPYLHGQLAHFISAIVVKALESQAEEARLEGREAVAPVVSGPADVWRQMPDFAERRAQWLDGMDGIPSLVDVRPLDAGAANLRFAVLEAIRRQVRPPD